jgi:benzoate/toluate 1,2-dioxygenase reductase component
MNPPQQFTAKLEEKITYNDKFTQFQFELVQPHTMEFAAGQYVSIKVDDKGSRRSYSICSSPAVAHGFELLIDMTPQGIGSQYLKGLKFGDEIEFLGPMGMFTIAEPSAGGAAASEQPVAVANPVPTQTAQQPAEEQIVLVATGSGITPFRSMVLDLLQVKHDPRPITLHWGVRHSENLIWLDEWQQLENAFANFKFHPVISKPLSAWPLCRGRVTDCLKTHDLPENAGYYLCGGQAMIQDVVPLLEGRGVTAAQIHHEKFF